MSERLHAEFRRDLCLDSADAAAMDALVDARPETGVFLSREWLSGYFDHRLPGVEYGLLVLRDGRALRAVAPLTIRHALTQSRIGIVGGGMGSDRVDLLAARGFEAPAADALLEWLQDTLGSRGFVLELRDVCATSPIWGAIHRTGAERPHRFAMQPREIYPLPYLPLHPAERDLGETPCARTTRSLEKHRRWLERRGAIRVEWLLEPDRAADAFDCLVRFLGARWRGHGDGSALDDPRAVRFHRCVLPRLLAAKRLRMMQITADGRTAAVFYGMAVGSWWGYYLAGYDREWAGRIHLGRVTLGAAIAAAIDEGVAEFDFLKGAERIKYSWPVRERTTMDADVFSTSCGVQLMRATRATRDATAALAKSARALFG